MRGKIILLFLFLKTGFVLFGTPSRDPFFYMKNMLNLTITVTETIAPSEGISHAYWDRYFITETNEKILLRVNADSPKHGRTFQFVVQPEEGAVILFRWTAFPQTEKIPPAEKLKLFFSSFIITDDNGNILKTLDSFTENDFTIHRIDEFDNITLLIQ